MSFRALLYTAAAVAFFIFMINRPAVEPPNANMQANNSSAEQSGSDAALTITATGQTDTSAGDGDTSSDASQTQQDGSATQSDTNAGSDTATASAEQSQGTGDSSATQADSDSQAASANTDDGTQATATGSNATDAAAQTAGSAVAAAASTQATAASDGDSAQAVASATPDYARERRISNEIRDAILEGDIFYLNDGSRSFMSIQTDAAERRGGALILHGRGFHPDWEDAVNPLRTGLAENGWTTLSLQMPVLEKDAKYYDYVPLFAEAGKRIQAGIRHLKQQGISPITIVAHSCGAHMAMQWVRDNGDADIAAYVGLGMGATDAGQQMAEPFPLDKMQIPVFDVYGEDDFPAVIKMAPDRLAQMTTAGNAKSEQHMLPEADHYFKDKGDELVGVVATWLNGL